MMRNGGTEGEPAEEGGGPPEEKGLRSTEVRLLEELLREGGKGEESS